MTCIKDTPNDWTIIQDGVRIGFISKHVDDDAQELFDARCPKIGAAHKGGISVPVGTYSTFEAAQNALIAHAAIHGVKG